MIYSIILKKIITGMQVDSNEINPLKLKKILLDVQIAISECYSLT